MKRGLVEMNNHDVLSYLDMRGVKDKEYKEFVFNVGKYQKLYKLCSVHDFDFVISHFLGNSDRMGYGVIPTNRVLKLDGSNTLVIALIEGDDVICIDVSKGEIFIWMIQTGAGEYVPLADSFKDFQEKYL